MVLVLVFTEVYIVFLQNPSLQMMFEGVLSGQNASRVTAEHLLQLDYFTKPIQEQIASPEPVTQIASPDPVSQIASPEPVSQIASLEHVSQIAYPEPVSPVTTETVVEAATKPPVIKNINEPMEIGVFRAEDYM